jgi:hypothetical protein
MATTFSPSLKLTLMGDGGNTGTWGGITNTNLGTLLEQAITGVQVITMINANYTLSNLNGTSDEARNAVLVIQGTNSATRQVICPLVNKTYIIKNDTTGGQDITIGGTTGSLVTVQNGTTQIVYCNGTNFYSVVNPNYITGNLNISGNLVVTGTIASSAGVSGTTGTFSGAVTGASFAGAGTGLTGTAAGLSIGGNAATATNATNATTAAAATTLSASLWTVQEASGFLVFRYNGVNKMKLDGSGNLQVAGNVSAYQSIS